MDVNQKTKRKKERKKKGKEKEKKRKEKKEKRSRSHKVACLEKGHGPDFNTLSQVEPSYRMCPEEW